MAVEGAAICGQAWEIKWSPAWDVHVAVQKWISAQLVP